MFSKELEVTISQAYQEARSARHEFLTVEHLLLALLDNNSALSVLSACGADINGLESELRKALSDTVPVLGDEDNRDTQPTIGMVNSRYQRVGFKCQGMCIAAAALGAGSRAMGSLSECRMAS